MLNWRLLGQIGVVMQSGNLGKRKRLDEYENNPEYIENCIQFINYPKAYQIATNLDKFDGVVAWLEKDISLHDISYLFKLCRERQSPLIPKLIFEQNATFIDSLESASEETIINYFSLCLVLRISVGMKIILKKSEIFANWLKYEENFKFVFELMKHLQNYTRVNSKVFYQLLEVCPAIFNYINKLPDKEFTAFIRHWLLREKKLTNIQWVMNQIMHFEGLMQLKDDPNLGIKKSYILEQLKKLSPPSPLLSLSVFAATAVISNPAPEDQLLATTEEELALLADQFDSGKLDFIRK